MVDMLVVLVVLVILYVGLKAFMYSDGYYDRFDKGAK